MKRIFSIIMGVLLLSSCEITGLFSGYNKLSREDKMKIVFLDSSANICEIENDGKIYAITGEQLRNCIETKENVLIYEWRPSCPSETCYPLAHVQKYCNSHGLDLYVVAAYYNAERMFIEQEHISNPLFSVNEKYYKKRVLGKYIKLFKGDLLNDDKSTEELWGVNTYIFNYGKLVDHSVKIVDDTEGQLKTIEF